MERGGGAGDGRRRREGLDYEGPQGNGKEWEHVLPAMESHQEKQEYL